MSITFPYDPWEARVDVPLGGLGSQLGYNVINNMVAIGHLASRREAMRNDNVGPAINGVIGVLAGALEWCRYYGLSATEVQSRVAAALAAHADSEKARILRAAHHASDIADSEHIASRLAPETKAILGL